MSKKESKCSSGKEDIYKYICPYNKNHKLTEIQYERHLERCPSKPKDAKNDINNNIDNDKININNENNDINDNNTNKDIDEKKIINKFVEDEKDDKCDIINPNPVIESNNFNLDVKYDGDGFEKEDFIFKQCYE